MKEDKQHICELLLATLQATRNLYDLVNLEYKVIDHFEEALRSTATFTRSYEEYVVATFSNGHKKTACVTADSGTAMIKDILNQIL